MAALWQPNPARSRSNPYNASFPRHPKIVRGPKHPKDVCIFELHWTPDAGAGTGPECEPLLLGRVPYRTLSLNLVDLREAIDRCVPVRDRPPDGSQVHPGSFEEGSGRPRRYAFTFADGLTVPPSLEQGLHARAFLPAIFVVGAPSSRDGEPGDGDSGGDGGLADQGDGRDVTSKSVPRPKELSLMASRCAERTANRATMLKATAAAAAAAATAAAAAGDENTANSFSEQADGYRRDSAIQIRSDITDLVPPVSPGVQELAEGAMHRVNQDCARRAALEPWQEESSVAEAAARQRGVELRDLLQGDQLYEGTHDEDHNERYQRRRHLTAKLAQRSRANRAAHKRDIAVEASRRRASSARRRRRRQRYDGGTTDWGDSVLGGNNFASMGIVDADVDDVEGSYVADTAYVEYTDISLSMRASSAPASQQTQAEKLNVKEVYDKDFQCDNDKNEGWELQWMDTTEDGTEKQYWINEITGEAQWVLPFGRKKFITTTKAITAMTRGHASRGRTSSARNNDTSVISMRRQDGDAPRLLPPVNPAGVGASGTGVYTRAPDAQRPVTEQGPRPTSRGTRGARARSRGRGAFSARSGAQSASSRSPPRRSASPVGVSLSRGYSGRKSGRRARTGGSARTIRSPYIPQSVTLPVKEIASASMLAPVPLDTMSLTSAAPLTAISLTASIKRDLYAGLRPVASPGSNGAAKRWRRKRRGRRRYSRPRDVASNPVSETQTSDVMDAYSEDAVVTNRRETFRAQNESSRMSLDSIASLDAAAATQQQQKHRAAQRLQAAARGRAVRKVVQQKAQEDSAATRVQAVTRGRAHRKRAIERQEAKRRQDAELAEQRRVQDEQRRIEKEQEDKEVSILAATKIQARQRGRNARVQRMSAKMTEYEVSFEAGPLGLAVRRLDRSESATLGMRESDLPPHSIIVHSVRGAAAAKGVQAGDRLYKIGHVHIDPYWTEEETTRKILEWPRPVPLHFVRRERTAPITSPSPPPKPTGMPPPSPDGPVGPAPPRTRRASRIAFQDAEAFTTEMRGLAEWSWTPSAHPTSPAAGVQHCWFESRPKKTALEEDQMKQAARKIFDQFDLDDDGFLLSTDFALLAKQIGDELEEDHVRSMFDQLVSSTPVSMAAGSGGNRFSTQHGDMLGFNSFEQWLHGMHEWHTWDPSWNIASEWAQQLSASLAPTGAGQVVFVERNAVGADGSPIDQYAGRAVQSAQLGPLDPKMWAGILDQARGFPTQLALPGTLQNQSGFYISRQFQITRFNLVESNWLPADAAFQLPSLPEQLLDVLEEAKQRSAVKQNANEAQTDKVKATAEVDGQVHDAATEKIDEINLEDPDQQAAAGKLQGQWRMKQSRKVVQTKREMRSAKQFGAGPGTATCADVETEVGTDTKTNICIGAEVEAKLEQAGAKVDAKRETTRESDSEVGLKAEAKTDEDALEATGVQADTFVEAKAKEEYQGPIEVDRKDPEQEAVASNLQDKQCTEESCRAVQAKHEEARDASAKASKTSMAGTNADDTPETVATAVQTKAAVENTVQEHADIDPRDPEQHSAAGKLQGQWRMKKSREVVQAKRDAAAQTSGRESREQHEANAANQRAGVVSERPSTVAGGTRSHSTSEPQAAPGRPRTVDFVSTGGLDNEFGEQYSDEDMGRSGDDDSDDSEGPLWEEFLDEKSGKTYYHNTHTGTTQWEAPPAAELNRSKKEEQERAEDARWDDESPMPREDRDIADELDAARPGASHGRRPTADAAESAKQGTDGDRGDHEADKQDHFSVIELQDGTGFEGMQPSVWTPVDDTEKTDQQAQVMSFDMGDENDAGGLDIPVDEGSSSDSDSEQAPPQWAQYMDATTQRPYYHNVVTGVTQWERPAGVEVVVHDIAESGGSGSDFGDDSDGDDAVEDCQRCGRYGHTAENCRAVKNVDGVALDKLEYK